MGSEIIGSDSLQIDYGTMNNIKSFTPVYHKDEDTFFLGPEKPRPATSVDWDGEFWLRVDPESGEVVGLEIEDFETVFLKKHPELASAWKEAKPLCHRKMSHSYEETTWEAFLRIILEFLQTFLKKNPQQASFGAILAH
ncbi:unnamed protein product [marine sediment metagenome]|uniref:Uncharacterized protein n=1 Tax=marine sediment metagenome TaxID=412755 RepID=X1LY66_9ZZZZ